jgi:hypothetical protein
MMCFLLVKIKLRAIAKIIARYGFYLKSFGDFGERQAHALKRALAF